MFKISSDECKIQTNKTSKCGNENMTRQSKIMTCTIGSSLASKFQNIPNRIKTKTITQYPLDDVRKITKYDTFQNSKLR